MNIKSFISKNAKYIFYTLLGFFLFYILIYDKRGRDDEYKKQIEQLQSSINKSNDYQKILNNEIFKFNREMVEIEKKLSEVENQKTIIKEFYHEKINSVDSYSDAQLDSFFTGRYGFTF
jgi:septal ring factor EnvC (AmiA/AmiB activator)